MSLIHSKEQQRSETSAGRTRTQCLFRKTNDWKSWVRYSKTISWGWQYPFSLVSRTCCLVFSQGCSFCFTSSLLDSPHCTNIGIFKPSWGALTLCSVPESDHSLHEEGHNFFVPQRKCKTLFFQKKSQGEEGEKICLNTQPSQIKTLKEGISHYHPLQAAHLLSEGEMWICDQKWPDLSAGDVKHKKTDSCTRSRACEIGPANNPQLWTPHTQTFSTKVNNAAVFYKAMKKLDVAHCKR